jgi:hypothetical protein
LQFIKFFFEKLINSLTWCIESLEVSYYLLSNKVFFSILSLTSEKQSSNPFSLSVFYVKIMNFNLLYQNLKDKEFKFTNEIKLNLSCDPIYDKFSFFLSQRNIFYSFQMINAF